VDDRARSTEVIATNDVDAILALDADCVFYAPWLFADPDTICRVLRSGKNVVTTAGYFHPNDDNRADGAKFEAACAPGEDHIGLFGFGKDKDEFLSTPTMLGMGVPFFAQAMAPIADRLGRTIDDLTTALTAATATEDITVNAIPFLCDAPPGWVTQLDIGLVQPRNLVRPR
jgi:hypothetical protein